MASSSYAVYKSTTETTMDPDHDWHYKEVLRRQLEEDQRTREMVADVKNIPNLESKYMYMKGLVYMGTVTNVRG
jgi:uncharacterized membrane protein YgaE (UPF0421/DUF939 family)